MTHVYLSTRTIRLLIVVGLMVATYACATYTAWHLCDVRYRKMLQEIDPNGDLREFIWKRDDGKTWHRLILHHPSGEMYSGWGEMGLLAFGGFVLVALGVLASLDLRRHRNDR